MTCKESDILFEQGDYWIRQVQTGYDVYKVGITHSTRCAQIGWPNTEYGFNRAKEEIARRIQNDNKG